MNDDLHEQIKSWIKSFKSIDEDEDALKDDEKLLHCPYLYVTCKNTSLNPPCRKVGMSYGEKINVKLRRYSTPVPQNWQLYAIVFINPKVAFDKKDEENFIDDISCNGKNQLSSKELVKSDDDTINKGILQFINNFGHVVAVALGKNKLYSANGFKALVNKKKTSTIKIDGNIAAILNEKSTCCKDYQMTYYWAHMLDECFCKYQLLTEGKTIEEVKQMENYPCGIKDETTIKCEDNLNESKATYLQKYRNEVDAKKIVDAFWQIKSYLSAPQNDIDWWIKKPFNDLKSFVQNFDTSNKRQRRDANYKQQAIDNDAKLLDIKDGYEIWYVPTYDAMVTLGRFYKGRSAKWCVALDDPDFWFDNHSDSEFVILVKENPQHNEFDKVAIKMMNHGRYYNEDDIIPWDLENENWTFTNDDLMHEAWLLFKDNGEIREQYFR